MTDPVKDPSQPLLGGSRVTFGTPWGNRIGDLTTIAWQIPLTFFVGTFLIIVLVMTFDEFVLELGTNGQSYAMWTLMVLLLALILPMSRTLLWWRCVLHPTHVQIGRPWLGGVEIPYDGVTLVRRSKTRAMERERDGAHAISITSDRGELGIWLGEADAEQCFQLLRQRCRAAAATDVDGTDYLPPDAEHEARGLEVLGGLHLTTGRVTLITGVALFLSGAIPAATALGGGELPPWKALARSGSGVVALVTGAGLRMRGRRLRRQGQGIVASSGDGPPEPEGFGRNTESESESE